MLRVGCMKFPRPETLPDPATNAARLAHTNVAFDVDIALRSGRREVPIRKEHESAVPAIVAELARDGWHAKLAAGRLTIKRPPPNLLSLLVALGRVAR